MNDTTSIQPVRGVSPAVPESKREKRLAWGRWSIRAVAITYLTVLLIIPLVIIFRDGLREGLSGRGAAW